MEVLKIEASKHKPGVIMDPHKHFIGFSGFSLPEDAMAFFLPIINWIYEYSNRCDELVKSNQVLKVEFKLSYYNSASYRAFLEMFHIFKLMREKNLKIDIDWYYEKSDSSMYEGGIELSEMISLPINFIELDS